MVPRGHFLGGGFAPTPPGFFREVDTTLQIKLYQVMSPSCKPVSLGIGNLRRSGTIL